MNRLFVIGDPVAHSRSPLIQTAMLRALGLEDTWSYEARQVEREETGAWLEACRRGQCRGFNATMPHKENLAALVDWCDPQAAACGSVNTVCIREGRAYGYSTDGAGFLYGLERGGIDPMAGQVVLLGAGGAARAVTLALIQLGVEKVTLCCRRREQGEALRALAPQQLAVATWESPQMDQAIACCRLLVNCTPLGMEGTGSQFSHLDSLQLLPGQAAVCDLIYRPAETGLLAQARQRGHRGINGLGMLIGQAICALEHFLDRPLDRMTMGRVVEAALAEEGEDAL